MSESLKVEMGIEDAGEFFEQEAHEINAAIEKSKGTPDAEHIMAIGKLFSLSTDEVAETLNKAA